MNSSKHPLISRVSTMAAWVPYSQRDAWEDVTPVPQNDGPHPVVPIAYSPKCAWLRTATPRIPRLTRRCPVRETMDYFRAIVQSGEVSERALEITADAIEMNPANYTAWSVAQPSVPSSRATTGRAWQHRGR